MGSRFSQFSSDPCYCFSVVEGLVFKLDADGGGMPHVLVHRSNQRYAGGRQCLDQPTVLSQWAGHRSQKGFR